MSLKQYLLYMTTATIVAYIVFLSVIYYFDPFVAGNVAVGFFYASLWLALVGTFSIIGFILRHFFTHSKMAFREVLISFRQGIWLALLIIVSLMLKHAGIFSILSVALLILALAVLEVFFINNSIKRL